MTVTVEYSASLGSVTATVINPSKANPLSQTTLPLRSVTTAPTGTASNPVITVDAGDKAQTIAGLGASLTGESANQIWAHLSTSPGSSGGVQGCPGSDSMRTCVLDSLFSPTSGAGISLVRISIGGSDFASAMPSSEEQEPGQFALSADDQDVIQVLKIAKQINPALQVIATPWTAPTWMKSNASYVGGSLESAYEKAYAAYFVDFIKEYKANGVTIDYVTPQNEPGDSTNDPSMVMSASNEAAFVDNDLSPALISNGLSTKILVYDWNWDTQSGTCPNASTCWSASGVKSVLNGAPSNVAGIAWHCYSVNSTDHGTATSQSLFQGSLHGSNPLQIMDECSGHGSNYPIAANLNWDSQNLVITSLNHFGSGVMFWNLALPKWPYTPPSGSCASTPQKDQYCRGVITVPSPTSVTFNVEYYILKALAASIEAGSTHVHTVSSDPSVITSTAASNLDGSTGLYVENSAAVSSVTVVDGTEEFTYPNALPADSVASFKWTTTTTTTTPHAPGHGAPSSWVVTEVPSPPGLPAHYVFDWQPPVSCENADACAALGGGGPNQATVIETLEKSTWHPETAPVPANSSGQVPTIGGISCAITGLCVAVGGYTQASTHQALIDTLTNGTWQAAEALLPSDASPTDPDANLATLSCGARGVCAALGEYLDATGASHDLIETRSGGSWVPTEVELPADASSNQAFAPAGLSEVSCSAPGPCEAIGTYKTTTGTASSLIGTLAGGSWTFTEAPVPAGGASGSAQLFDLSCGTDGTCAAAGTYSGPNGHSQELLETLVGARWIPRQAPLPADAKVNFGLAGNNPLSCGTAGTCTAVASYQDRAGFDELELQTLSGGTWRATQAPVPLDAVRPQDPQQSPIFGGISCGGAGRCITVGTYTTMKNDPPFGDYLDTLVNGSWKTEEEPSDAFWGAYFPVACNDSGSCVAAGVARPGLDPRREKWFIRSSTGGPWATSEGPPPSSNSGFQLMGVSCGPSGACAAEYAAADRSGGRHEFVVYTSNL